MNKNLKALLITLCVLLVITSFFVVRFFIDKSHLNPDDHVGNSAYNLNNGGKFCEINDKVYFANSYDSDALYVMNSDETNAKKITSTSVVSINADDHRIYYSMSPKSNGQGLGYIRKSAGLYSINHSGRDSICYTTNPVAQCLLYGNTLYYQNYIKNSGTSIYAITTDRNNNHEVINQFVTFTNPYWGYIYYGNMSDNHHLYIYDPLTMQSESYWAHDVYMPVYDSDGWIYFIDPNTDYELHRYNPQSETEEIITDQRVDFYNKIGDIIYYQVSVGDPALHRVMASGGEDIVIAEGVYNDIQTTSNYVYFRPFDNDTVTFHANHYGTLKVNEFRP